MRETITPRVVAVCDAVDRSGVSSSSSASIFEVLRDSQILGERKENSEKHGMEDEQSCHF